jgi:acyl-CoA thioester hydrolase
VNNSIYYHLFDSIVNTYLIQHCGLSPQASRTIGLVVSSHCSFFAPVAFPDVLELGLRATKLGNSSVVYEVGVFRDGEAGPNAVGGYTHVFVHSENRKTAKIEGPVREGLEKLLNGEVCGGDKAKL